MNWKIDFDDHRKLVKQFLQNNDYAGDYEMISDDPANDDLGVMILAETEKPTVMDGRPKYYCSFCNRNNQFWSGFFVLCSDGSVRLIGNKCAADHIGSAAWASATREYEERRISEVYGRIHHKLPQFLTNAVEELQSKKDSDSSLARTAEQIQVFRKKFPSVFEQIRIVVEKNQSLTVVRSGHRGSKSSWHIRGGGIFKIKLEIFTLLKRGEIEMQTALNHVPALSGKNFEGYVEEFEKIRVKIREAVDNIEKVEHLCRDWIEFLSTENLKVIVHWLNSIAANQYVPNFERAYVANGGFAIKALDDSPRTRFILPRHHDATSFPATAQLKEHVFG